MINIHSHSISWGEQIHGFDDDSQSEIHRGKFIGDEIVIKRIYYRNDFENEAKIMSSIDHPNVMKLKGAFLYGSLPCIVMNYMPKGSLKQYIQKLNKNWEDSARNKMTFGIACGLHVLHAANILHLDLKTANILIDTDDDGDDIPKIADFGLSIQLEPTEICARSNKVRGTIDWNAPEISLVSGDINVYSKELDIYSFALVIWVMHTFLEIDELDSINCVSAKDVNEPALQRLCTLSWSAPEKRPKIEEFVETLKAIAPSW